MLGKTGKISYFLAIVFLASVVFVDFVNAQSLPPMPTGGQLSVGGGSGGVQGIGETGGAGAGLEVVDIGANIQLGGVISSQWGVDVSTASRETARETLKTVLSGAWMEMVHTFTQQLAYDTASWIASGGKGQQPLFITEGIGAYLKDTADKAIGSFIDEIDNQFGVNLCSPNLQVKLMIKAGLTEPPREPKCRFSKMITNWRSAVKDPNFSNYFSTYLTSNENDVGIYLTLKSDLMDKVARDKNDRTIEAVINDGFKDLKNYTGWILTPGTMIKKQYEKSVDDADKGELTYKGTAYDFIATFLDTLVGKMLQNLQTGFFSDSAGSSGPSFSDSASNLITQVRRLAALLRNPESSPTIEGELGAASRLGGLLMEGDVGSGGKYDILNKLVICTDAAKTNPGPTDCVIDQAFAGEVRKNTLIRDLPDNILNRKFTAEVDENSSPQEIFTLRSILILRKYRIVPVGWEIAAKYIDQYNSANQSGESYTLRQLVGNFYNADSPFYGLVDPSWVLKAPELYCRKEGYGERNNMAQEGKSLRRDKYCADEQQCIKEDKNGNCLAYGYCTEEEKFWNFKAQACEPINNTCQTFQSRAGTAVSYLASTLDYRDCNAQNAGCRWYSNWFNPVSNSWTHTDSGKILKQCTVTSPTYNSATNSCTATGSLVPQWEQVSMSGSNGVIMSEPCRSESGCDFSAKTCVIPEGGVKCSLDSCLSAINSLASMNPGWENSDGAEWNAQFWNEAYINDNNRHFRSKDNGRTGAYALQSISFYNSNDLSSSLPNITGVTPNSDYKLVFYGRGSISAGAVSVAVYSGLTELARYSVGFPGENWREYYVNFTTEDNDQLEIRVITGAGATGSVFLDDFELKQLDSNCVESSIAGDENTTAFLVLGEETKTDKDIYFDRDAQSCNEGEAGCNQFIRTEAGIGSNLIPNSSFEIDKSDLNGRRSADVAHTGSYSYKLSDDSEPTIGLSSLGLKLKSNNRYILSVWTYYVGNNNTNRFALRAITDSAEYVTEDTDAVFNQGQWGQMSAVINIAGDDQNLTELEFDTFAADPAFEGVVYFDDIKLERVNADVSNPTDYTPYEPTLRPINQLAFLKKAPDYYSCYTTGGVWPTTEAQLLTVLANRHSACANYSGVCIAEEMDCELYTPENGDPAVPGTVTSADVCPAGCVGYQTFKQEPTAFTSAKYENFIPEKPTQFCSASAAGCDEFTNLDEAEKGGEAKEYYTQLRICQLSDAPNQSFYYTWEGNDTTGYQLKSFTLIKSQVAGPTAPCTNASYGNDGVFACADPVDSNNPADNTGACLPENMADNPNCREFYDTNGNKSYRLLSRVIYVSDDCHPYRRTQTQDTVAESAEDCRDSGGYWNSFNECVYMAIPNQGGVCSQPVFGCREYTGNRGNAFRNVFNSAFEDGVDSWNGGTISAESTYPGGNSLTNGANSKLFKNISVGNGKAYSLSFWAKGNADFDIDGIRFSDAPAESSFLTDNQAAVANITVPITAEWKLYNLGPVFVTWGNGYFDQNLEINLPSGSRIFIDNIILKELTQSVFALENSWFTPVACDNTLSQPYGDPADGGGLASPVRSSDGEMLGCQRYRDRAGTIFNLKSFENLCRRDAVGCEEVIDTYNSDNSDSETFNSGDSSQITVPGDQVVYLVNDDQFRCNAGAKGCSALGAPLINNRDEVFGYFTAYLKNDPDRYSTDLCKSNALWCDEFVGANNLSYFKDPRHKLCEYKTLANTLEPKWYKKDSAELCDATYLNVLGGETTRDRVQPIGWFNSANHPSVDTWYPLNGDYSGYTNAVVRYGGWAGTCPTAQSGCTEYIDPLTNIYKNEIKNVVLSGAPPYYWKNVAGHYEQKINLKVDTLYSFSTDDPAVKLEFSACSGYVNSPDNTVDFTEIQDQNPPIFEIKVKAGLKSARFQIISSMYVNETCQATVILPALSAVDNLKITESGVYYALANQVDKGGCNGLVDNNTGCILFNDRSSVNYNSADIASRSDYLNFDADLTYQSQLSDASQVAQTPTKSENGNASVVLKVKPDRKCAEWLNCTSYIKGNASSTNPQYGDQDKCLSLGSCVSFGENGICNQPGNNAREELYYDSGNSNKTGYSLVGDIINSPNRGAIGIRGYYPFETMVQNGGSATVANGDFETVFGDKSEPLGWEYGISGVEWYSGLFEIIFDNAKAPEGGGYLKVNGKHNVSAASGGVRSERIDVARQTDYYLSFYVNTMGINRDPQKTLPYYAEIDVFSINGVKLLDEGNLFKAGLGWQHQSIKFNTGNHSQVVVVLSNTAGVADGSFSFWDNIELKNVLKVNGEDENSGDFITRSCRWYPESDSRSCKYYKGDDFYYGNYSYCLLKDPKNPKQCLQWWPVDEIRGETLEEFSGYSDARPLYYCIGEGTEQVEIKDLATAARFNTANLSEDFEFLSDLDTGKGMVFVPFVNAVPAEYLAFFRYPYVSKFIFNGFFAGVGVSTGQSGGKLKPLHAEMYPNKVEVNWFNRWNPTDDQGEWNDNLTSCYISPNRSGSNEPEDSIKEDMLEELYPDFCQTLFKIDDNNPFTPNCPSNTGCVNVDAADSGNNHNDIVFLNVVVDGERYSFDSENCCSGATVLDISSHGHGTAPPNEDNNHPSNGNAHTYTGGDARFNNKGDIDNDDFSPIGLGEEAKAYKSVCEGLAGCYQGFKFRVQTKGTDSNGFTISQPDQCEALCDKYLPDGGSVGDTGYMFNASHKNGWSGSFNDSEAQRFFGDPREDPDDYSEYDYCQKACNMDIDKIINKFRELQSTNTDRESGFWFRALQLLAGLPGKISALLNPDNDRFIIDEDSWGGWGFEGFHINTFSKAFPVPWHVANRVGGESFLKEVIQLVISLVEAFKIDLPEFGRASGGLKIVTDQDRKFGSAITDPMPDQDGDILGMAYFLDYTGKDIDSIIFSGQLKTDFTARYCDKVVQTVKSSGANKAWLSRVSPASQYRAGDGKDGINKEGLEYYHPFNYLEFLNSVSCSPNESWEAALDYEPSDYRPFGAIVPPTNSSQVTMWDSKSGIPWRQPLLVEPPNLNLPEPYQPRAGTVYSSVGDLKRLFLTSYGVWTWDEISKRYEEVGGNWDYLESWGESGGYCPDANGDGVDERPVSVDSDYDICRVHPKFGTVKLTESSNNLARLDFSVTINPDQLPITAYEIHWGDYGDTVTGVSLRSKIAEDNPFIFYHYYNYYALLDRDDDTTPLSDGVTVGDLIDCDEENGFCDVHVFIKVTDNWNAAKAVQTTDSDFTNLPYDGIIQVSRP